MTCAVFRFATVLLFAPLVLSAIEPPPGVLLDPSAVCAAAKSVTAERFPDADRVWVDDHVFERYEKDGTSEMWDDEYCKILTEKGRRQASTVNLEFMEHYGSARICRAEIIKPDGKVIPIDVEKYSRVMTDPGQMGANIYDPSSKVLSCAIPGLEVGDICHLITCRITSKPRIPNTWSDFTALEADSPLVKLDYTVLAPPELPLRHQVLRAPVAGTVSAEEKHEPDGRIRYTWRVLNVPQMFPEPDMPPLHTQVQRLILSTIPDWKTVSRWYWELCQPAMAKTTPEMRTEVDRLIAGAATREEKIRRIFKFVSQEIRYMGITTEDTAPGYEPHEVSLTFNNRYGVCRDKAALLAAMLTMAGIQGYPVLIHAGAKMDPDVPIPYFNHAITAVDKPGGGYVLMDPTDENTRELFPAYLCNRSYLVARPQGETLLVSDVYPAEKNLTRIVTDGKLDGAGTLMLKTSVTFEGINDNVYRGHFLRQKADQRQKFFESVLKRRLPGAEVLACEIEPEDLQDTETPLSVVLTARVPGFPVSGEGLDLVTTPWLGTIIGYVNFVIGQTGLNVRRYPMETGITCGVDERVTLDISAALGAPRELPPDVKIDRAGVEFSMRQSVTGGKLEGRLRYLLKTPEFSPSEYLALKAILREVEAVSRQRPLFVRKEAFPPDQETLFSELDTRLDSPQAWTTTHTWSRRILTYAGKKKGSELTFSYNPAWQTVDVISATVSNVDGTVRQVSAKEKNVMDAAWVGGAPRYPAGKTLVVNLPGVETGSVITVTTRYTQTHASFYSHVHTFGGTEPVLSETYRLTYPKGFEPKIQFCHPGTVTCVAETNEASVVLTYHAPSQPVVRSEELLPPWHFFQPTLYLSFGDWRAYARQLRRMVRDATTDGDAEARRKARELVRGVKDPRDRIRAVRNEVLRTVRPAGPSFLDLPPGSFSTPDRTLADQYGNPADRAILLAAMLNAVGFDAEVLLAGKDTTDYAAYSQPSRDIPQMGFYGNPLVRVSHKGWTVYLNDGDQYDELGASSADLAPALRLDGKTERIAVSPATRDKEKTEWSVEVDPMGTARVTVSNWFFGTQAGRFRKQYEEMLPEDRRRHHLERVGDIAKSAVPVSELVTDTESYPCVRTYTVAATNYAAIGGSTLSLMIPDSGGAIFPIRADTRENPLFFGGNSTSEWSCRITLPAGYTRLPIVPETKHWTLPNGLGEFDYRVWRGTRPDGRLEVFITRQLDRSSGEAAPELYPALLEYNRRSMHPSMRMLVAEKGP